MFFLTILKFNYHLLIIVLYNFMNKKKAFTLVELVISIVILAILWTIVFITLQWYSKDTRDSARISDISSIKTSLELFNLDAWKYPIPSKWVDITYSWSIVWNQWEIWESVYVNLSKLDKISIDPLINTQYTYSVLSVRDKYQLWWMLEWDNKLTNINLLNNTNAWNMEALAYVSWNYNWQIVKVLSWTLCQILSVPSIITNDTNITNLEQIINEERFVYNWYNNLPSSLKTSKYDINWGFAFKPNKLIAYKDNLSCSPLTDKTNISARIELLKWIQESYSWTILKDIFDIKNTLSINTGSWNINENTKNYIWSFVNNNLWWHLIIDKNALNTGWNNSNWAQSGSGNNVWWPNWPCEDVITQQQVDSLNAMWLNYDIDIYWDTNWDLRYDQSLYPSWFTKAQWCNDVYIVDTYIPNWITADLVPAYNAMNNLSQLRYYESDYVSKYAYLNQLNDLYLSFNWFTWNINDILAFSKLKWLTLSSSSLTEIPSWIYSLTNLEGLWLSSNQISTISPSILNLTKLKELWLYNNKVNSIPAELLNLVNLTTLDLSVNLISSIPSTIWNLTNLTYLGIWLNQLTVIPPEIWNLVNLTWLSIYSNNLTSLPSTLANLKKLKSLSLGWNNNLWNWTLIAAPTFWYFSPTSALYYDTWLEIWWNWTNVVINSCESFYTSWDWSVSNPYLISNANQVNVIRCLPNSNFRLTQDISLTSYSAWTWWQPIIQFYWTLDWNWFKITDFTYNRPSESTTWLFAFTNSWSSIKNLWLITWNVTWYNQVSTLAWNIGWKVENSYVIVNWIVTTCTNCIWWWFAGSVSNSANISNNYIIVNWNIIWWSLGWFVWWLTNTNWTPVISNSYSIINWNITSSWHQFVWWFAAINHWIINNSHTQVTWNVTSSYNYYPSVWWFVWYNDYQINNSYSYVWWTISSTYLAGAFVANNAGPITNSYCSNAKNYYWSSTANTISWTWNWTNWSNATSNTYWKQNLTDRNFMAYSLWDTNIWWRINTRNNWYPYLVSLLPSYITNPDPCWTFDWWDWTQSTPYLISNASQLAWLNCYLNDPNIYFELTSNIDLSWYQTWLWWTPIWNRTNLFEWKLNWNNHTISWLFIDNLNSTEPLWLFWNLYLAQISNLTLNVESITWDWWVWWLVWYLDSSQLNNITANVNWHIYSTWWAVWWLVGYSLYWDIQNTTVNVNTTWLINWDTEVGWVIWSNIDSNIYNNSTVNLLWTVTWNWSIWWFAWYSTSTQQNINVNISWTLTWSVFIWWYIWENYLGTSSGITVNSTWIINWNRYVWWVTWFNKWTINNSSVNLSSISSTQLSTWDWDRVWWFTWYNRWTISYWTSIVTWDVIWTDYIWWFVWENQGSWLISYSTTQVNWSINARSYVWWFCWMYSSAWWSISNSSTIVQWNVTWVMNNTSPSYWYIGWFCWVTWNSQTISNSSSNIWWTISGWFYVWWFIWSKSTSTNISTWNSYVYWSVNWNDYFWPITWDKYTISFNWNWWTWHTPTSKIVTYSLAIWTLPTNPAKTWYTFTGWFTATTWWTQNNTWTTIMAPATWYAQWLINNYTVTFDWNGWTWHTPETKSVTYNTAVWTLPSNPTRSWYTFKWWYTATTWWTKITTATVVTNNVTWYGQRTQDWVCWSANGTPVSVAPSANLCSVWTASAVTSNVWTYTWSCTVTWAQTASCSAPRQYTVTYNWNGWTWHTPTTMKVVYNTAVWSFPTNPTKSWFTFKGWFTATTWWTQITTSNVVTANVTWYAQWY